MNDIIKLIDSKSIKNRQMKLLCMFSILIFVGLLCRDSFGISISKYAFLIICIFPIFFFDIRTMSMFFCFIIPLYVGLPGNYISIFILFRFLLEMITRKHKIDILAFYLSTGLCIYINIQNMYYEQTDIYYIMGAVDFIILLLFIKFMIQNSDIKSAVIMYTLGVFATVVIMLTTTLRSFTIIDLLNNSTRLGMTGMLGGTTISSMYVSIDPNFLGMNAIAVVSSSCLVITRMSKGILRSMFTIIVVGVAGLSILGLSRAYVLVLFLWIVAYLVSQGDIKRGIVFLLLVLVLFILFRNFLPNFYNALMMRFSGSDILSGNGRIQMITKGSEQWTHNVQTLLFGVGLYNCHTHCAPLLYLYGLGIVGFIVLLALEIRYIFLVTQNNKCKFRKWLPFLFTLLMSATIPAVGAISYIFPLFLSIIVLSFENEKRDSVLLMLDENQMEKNDIF